MPFHTYRANKVVARGRDVPSGADAFIEVELPDDYQMGGTVGAGRRPIEKLSDESATATINCGALTVAHATMSEAYLEQEVRRSAGSSPIGTHVIQFDGGDGIVGQGVISRPPSLSGGVETGERGWRLMLAQATYVPAKGLAALLAAEGAG